MNSAPMNSPTFPNSDDGHISEYSDHISDKADYSDTVEDPVPTDDNVVNSCATVNGDCEKSADADSDAGCDGFADGSQFHDLIMQCQQNGCTRLDLSRHGLRTFCHKLLELTNLQVIFLFYDDLSLTKICLFFMILVWQRVKGGIIIMTG